MIVTLFFFILILTINDKLIESREENLFGILGTFETLGWILIYAFWRTSV